MSDRTDAADILDRILNHLPEGTSARERRIRAAMLAAAADLRAGRDPSPPA